MFFRSLQSEFRTKGRVLDGFKQCRAGIGFYIYKWVRVTKESFTV